MDFAGKTQASADDLRRSAWMAAAQSGDRHAYETLLRNCVPLIETMARRRGVSADRIDDVVQDVLLTIHRARHTYDPRRSFTAWLRTLAERRAIDLLRRTGRQSAHELYAPLAYESYADDGPDASAGLVRADAVGQAGRAIAALPARQREAVQLLVMQEQSLSAAELATGRTKVALKVNLHRALKALRARLEGKD